MESTEPASSPGPHKLQAMPLSYAPRTDRPQETFAGGIFFAWMALGIWMLFALGLGVLVSQLLGPVTIFLAIPIAFGGTLLACFWITRWDRRSHTRNSQGVLIGAWSFLGMAVAAGTWVWLAPLPAW